MSTATLLLIAARLRSLGREEPRARPAMLSDARMLAVAGLVLLAGAAGLARAQQATPPPQMRAEGNAPQRAGAGRTQHPCVSVDVPGELAGRLDCAAQRLQDAARSAQKQARAGIDTPVIGAGSPDVRTGVAHEGATRLRMGSALGRSVRPERPATPSRGGGR